MSEIIQYNKPSKLIFDKKSKRKIDPSTGQLIADVLITAEEVVEYAGFENEQFIEDGFKSTDIISVYRPWEEIKKGSETIQGKPGIWGHAETNVDNIKDLPHIGTVLSSTELDEKNHQLKDRISIHDKDAIENILNGNDGVSAGYTANYVRQNGVFKGTKYDYIQTDIEYNHLAVGVDPRCAVARVLDSKPSFLNVMEGDKPMSKKINVEDQSLTDIAKIVEDSDTIVTDSDTKVPSLNANKEISPELDPALIFDESEEEMTGDKNCNKDMSKDEKDVEKIKKTTEDSAIAKELSELRKEMNQLKKERKMIQDSQIQIMKNSELINLANNSLGMVLDSKCDINKIIDEKLSRDAILSSITFDSKEEKIGAFKAYCQLQSQNFITFDSVNDDSKDYMNNMEVA